MRAAVVRVPGAHGQPVGDASTKGVLPDLAALGGPFVRLSLDVSEEPEALLVKSGAFFDFAADWCTKHPQLVHADLDSSVFFKSPAPPDPSDAQAVKEAREAARASFLQRLRSALRNDDAVFRDLKTFLRTHDGSSDRASDRTRNKGSRSGNGGGSGVWERSEALRALERAEMQVVSSGVSTSSSVSLAAIHEAKEALRREYLAYLDTNAPRAERPPPAPKRFGRGS